MMEPINQTSTEIEANLNVASQAFADNGCNNLSSTVGQSSPKPYTNASNINTEIIENEHNDKNDKSALCTMHSTQSTHNNINQSSEAVLPAISAQNDRVIGQMKATLSEQVIDGDDAVASVPQNHDNVKNAIEEFKRSISAEEHSENSFLKTGNDAFQIDYQGSNAISDAYSEKKNELRKKYDMEEISTRESKNESVFRPFINLVNSEKKNSDDKIVYTISDDDDTINKKINSPKRELKVQFESDVINLDDEDELSSDNRRVAKFDNSDAFKQMNVDKTSAANSAPKTTNEQPNHRLLYKCEIEDSEESCAYKVPRDDIDDELTNDTFASLNEDGDSRNEHSVELVEEPLSRPTSLESPKERPTDNVKPVTSKINGNYNSILLLGNEKTDEATNIAVTTNNTIKGSFHCVNKPSNYDFTQRNSTQNNIFKYDVTNKETTGSQSASPIKSPQLTVDQHPIPTTQQMSNDEESRCSTLASFASSATSNSSMHQLVIDHRIEESDPINTTKSHEQQSQMSDEGSCFKIAPLKIGLKRKLSNSNVDSPKRAHVEDEQPSFSGNQLMTKPQFGDSQFSKFQSSEMIPPPTEKLKSAPPTPSSMLPESLFSGHFQRLSNVVERLPTTVNTNNRTTDTTNLEGQNHLCYTTDTTNLEGQNHPCYKCKKVSFVSILELLRHVRTCGLEPAVANSNDNIATSSIQRYNVPQAAASATQTSALMSQGNRFYSCKFCRTYHDIWSFFHHVREQHGRYLCLYCARCFPTAEKLALHLEHKHDLEQDHFNSELALRESSNVIHKNMYGYLFMEQYTQFLICCSCQYEFLHQEPFAEHTCGDYMKPCQVCGQKGCHATQCRARPDANHFLTNNDAKSNTLNVPTTMPFPLEQSSLQPPQPLPLNEFAPNCDNSGKTIAATVPPTFPPHAPVAATFARTPADGFHGLHRHMNNIRSNVTYGSTAATTAVAHQEAEMMARGWTPQPLSERVVELNEAGGPIAGNSADGGAVKLVVPKLKLRVPKEFQKSVDAVISSSDSDDEDEEEPNAADEDCALARTTDMDAPNLSQAVATVAPPKADSAGDEDSMDERHSNLLRLIEQTKLDIRRAREKNHSAQHSQTIGGAATPAHAPVGIGKAHSDRDGGKNWSPTPPASPHSRPMPLESVNAVAAESFATTNRIAQRRDSEGSDAMDIDETISCDQIQILAQSEKSRTASGGLEHGGLQPTTSDVAPSVGKDAGQAAPQIECAAESVKPPSLLMAPAPPLPPSSPPPPPPPASSPPAAPVSPPPAPPADGIEVANEDTHTVDLQLNRALEKYEIVDFVRICLMAVYPLCLYCNHARRIAVNGESLVLHMIAHHRFSATVDSITAEELMPSTIVRKLKSFLPALQHSYLNAGSYYSPGAGSDAVQLIGKSPLMNECAFECFQCRFVAATHKELYLHNRKLHLRTAILCFMCRSNFYHFSEMLCHLCPGAPHKCSAFDISYRCCLCSLDKIPSTFRLMVHLRRHHCTCDVCLENCADQARLSSHVWKHKLNHLCYRCGLAYRNKVDISKHLFWKHGTESSVCKRCLQKRWRHVYHFCMPPSTFECDECSQCFSRAMYLTVHKRTHADDLRYACTEPDCAARFVSRKLLSKHAVEHQPPQPAAGAALEGDGDGGETKPFAVKADPLAQDDVKPASADASGAAACEQRGTDDVPSVASGDNSAKKDDGADASEQQQKSSRRRKKSKRAKEEFLDDLNLTAPNLSESDSSRDSDGEYKSRDNSNDATLLVPNIMLSPPSEAEADDEEAPRASATEAATAKTASSPDSEPDAAEAVADAGNVLAMWKSLLQAQQEDGVKVESVDASVALAKRPQHLHVGWSDHDYCNLRSPPPPPPVVARGAKPAVLAGRSPIREDGASEKSSSSSDDSSSDSSSSCSCSSKCSCSSGSSGSSATSRSSKGSNSSTGSNVSRVKRHRKKSERDRLRQKSQSISPTKRHSAAAAEAPPPTANDDGTRQPTTAEAAAAAALKLEDAAQLQSAATDAAVNESDLQTEESASDEEFYDKHPQKVANERFTQKRAQLMARTLLSPSHSFDIVENSRPSTPSLPDEMAASVGKLPRQKKKKRDRKSTGGHASSKLKAQTLLDSAHTPSSLLMPQHFGGGGGGAGGHGVGSPHVAHSFEPLQYDATAAQHAGMALAARPSPMQSHMPSRMSEGGSSCSDLDGSLKRSKRARRPNKFYGYTSDDDGSAFGLGQSLVIGTRTFKPTPPPQLTWCKEDLPTPPRSNKKSRSKKSATPRAPSEHATDPAAGGGAALLVPKVSIKKPSNRRRQQHSDSTKAARSSDGAAKRQHANDQQQQQQLPPIPTLKIRPFQLAAPPPGEPPLQSYQYHQHGQYNNSAPPEGVAGGDDDNDDDDDDDDDDDEDEEDSSDSSSDEDSPALNTTELWRNALQQHASMPATTSAAALLQPPPVPLPLPVAPPAPRATVFNHKVPPALLPNPDFATLQYFKANNIRYPIRPPAGARQARDGESVYCYCRCPYDEVSEMIACDGDNCLIEWFHFECVGIMVAPQGKWFCAECRPQYSEELYPIAASLANNASSKTLPSMQPNAAAALGGAATGVNAMMQPYFNGTHNEGNA